MIFIVHVIHLQCLKIKGQDLHDLFAEALSGMIYTQRKSIETSLKYLALLPQVFSASIH